MFNHNESNSKCTNVKTSKVLIIAFITKCLFSLFGVSYKNIPNISPASPQLTVNPGKYAPNGQNIAPIKSPKCSY